jgi:hypothetical protein
VIGPDFCFATANDESPQYSSVTVLVPPSLDFQILQRHIGCFWGLSAQGRSHALYYGGHLQRASWHEAAWRWTLPELPAIVVNLLEPLRRLLAAVEVELKVRTQELETATP